MLEVTGGNKDEVANEWGRCVPAETVDAGWVNAREIVEEFLEEGETPGGGRRAGPCQTLTCIVSGVVGKLGCVRGQVLVGVVGLNRRNFSKKTRLLVAVREFYRSDYARLHQLCPCSLHNLHYGLSQQWWRAATCACGPTGVLSPAATTAAEAALSILQPWRWCMPNPAASPPPPSPTPSCSSTPIDLGLHVPDPTTPLLHQQRRLCAYTRHARGTCPCPPPPTLWGWIGSLRGRCRHPTQRRTAGLRESAVPRKT